MLQTSQTRTLSNEDIATLYDFATKTVWRIKERTMRTQFERLIQGVRDGNYVSTEFAPIAQDDVDDVYNAVVAVVDFLTNNDAKRRIDAIERDRDGGFVHWTSIFSSPDGTGYSGGSGTCCPVGEQIPPGEFAGL